MFKLQTLFLAFGCLSALGQQLTPDGCYNEYLDTRVMCVEALEVCKNIANCQDCMAICTQFSGVCTAVMYRMSTQECYVYRQAVKPGGFGRMKRAAGCYGSMPPMTVNNQPDYTYYIASNSSTCNPATGSGGASATTSVVINNPASTPVVGPNPTATPAPVVQAVTTMVVDPNPFGSTVQPPVPSPPPVQQTTVQMPPVTLAPLQQQSTQVVQKETTQVVQQLTTTVNGPPAPDTPPPPFMSFPDGGSPCAPGCK